MVTRKKRVLLLVAMSLSLEIFDAVAADYTFTDRGYGNANAINGHGQIVGTGATGNYAVDK